MTINWDTCCGEFNVQWEEIKDGPKDDNNTHTHTSTRIHWQTHQYYIPNFPRSVNTGSGKRGNLYIALMNHEADMLQPRKTKKPPNYTKRRRRRKTTKKERKRDTQNVTKREQRLEQQQQQQSVYAFTDAA